jgi:hypothetical protein
VPPGLVARVDSRAKTGTDRCQWPNAPGEHDFCTYTRRARGTCFRSLENALAARNVSTHVPHRTREQTRARNPGPKDEPSRTLRTEQQKSLLIELDAFTPEELAETTKEVQRGDLQLSTAEAFLSHLYGTLSLADTAGYLGWSDDAVSTAAEEGRLYAVEIADRLRFPYCPLSVSHNDKLLPGPAELTEVLTPRWSWQGVTVS